MSSRIVYSPASPASSIDRLDLLDRLDLCWLASATASPAEWCLPFAVAYHSIRWMKLEIRSEGNRGKLIDRHLTVLEVVWSLDSSYSHPSFGMYGDVSVQFATA